MIEAKNRKQQKSNSRNTANLVQSHSYKYLFETKMVKMKETKEYIFGGSRKQEGIRDDI